MKPILLLLSALLCAAPARSADLEAWIDVEEQDGLLIAIPKVKVPTTRMIRYEMAANRTGAAGTSNTKQAGARTVACCDPLALAHVRINFSPADVCSLALVVYEKEEVVARVERECKKP